MLFYLDLLPSYPPSVVFLLFYLTIIVCVCERDRERERDRETERERQRDRERERQTDRHREQTLSVRYGYCPKLFDRQYGVYRHAID